jgi:hypothetical protein
MAHVCASITTGEGWSSSCCLSHRAVLSSHGARFGASTAAANRKVDSLTGRLSVSSVGKLIITRHEGPLRTSFYRLQGELYLAN